jgi:hypothetical protein
MRRRKREKPKACSESERKTEREREFSSARERTRKRENQLCFHSQQLHVLLNINNDTEYIFSVYNWRERERD